ncbi:MAG TPA: LytTR family DNA-binding domain-containing protein [Methylomirabilota bacterium]|nr:LytTR family DNA-binding domain-containing protein [Methylomirabilota bacterium]
MKIRTVIVDDEPLARSRLKTLLKAESDIELLAECATGQEAIETLDAKSPDLVFLDVQMPELSGFDVLDALKQRPLPRIIFVTAHDQFALKAFEVHAIDYLLKPFDRERFQQALDRAREELRRQDPSAINDRLTALLAELPGTARAPDRLVIKSGGRVILLKLADIDWIEAADNYLNLHLGNETHLHRETLSSIESRLPAGQFLRISRSTIVNVDRIKELQPMFHGDYVVILRNGTRLNLSRTYRDQLQKLL